MMVDTLSLFLAGGSIGSNVDRTDTTELNVSSVAVMPQFKDLPLVVLIDAGITGPPEIFAAAIQARGRARIVGVPTAGQSGTGTVHTLGDGSELRFAEIAYRLPNGSAIDGRGVQPDKVVDEQWWRFPLDTDPQVQAAIEVLTAP